MRASHVVLLGVVVALACGPSVWAGTINVLPGQSIQAAIDAASGGDEVVVAPGTYVERIDFVGKAITVRGTAPSDPAVVAATTIDGDSGGSVVTFASGETSSSVLQGLTVTNGTGTLGSGRPGVYDDVLFGGGIYCVGSSPTICDNRVILNTAWGGGGIYAGDCDPTISRNTISGNRGWSEGGGVNCRWGAPVISENTITGNRGGSVGAGIYCCDSSPSILGNTITDNSECYMGGGIGCEGGSYPTISGNTIVGNSAAYDGGGIHGRGTISGNTIVGNSADDDGGGIHCTSGTISGNTIVGNEAGRYGGGVYAWGGTALVNCIVAFSGGGGGVAGGASVRYCNAYDNSGGNYVGMADPTGTNGNIPVDPLFANLAGGDFHLKSTVGRWDPLSLTWVIDGVDSPCIDAGDPFGPFGNEPSPNGGRLNMGAYGNTAEASKSSNSPPTQPVVDVTPDAPLTTDDLHVAASGSTDPDGDPVAYRYRWYRDGAHQSGLNDQTTVPASATARGQTWRCVVTPHDGRANRPAGEDSVVILNSPPVADDDAYSTNEDTQLVVGAPGVLDGDTDVDGDPLTAALDDDVDHGTLALNANGSFTYDPDTNWNGTDQFTYEVTDGHGGTDEGTVTITVNPVNDPPVANDDGPYAMDEGTTLDVNGVLDNDTDAENDPLTAILVADVQHGALTLDPDGSFTYTPDADYVGPDQFTYKANDGLADSNVATATIVVQAGRWSGRGWHRVSVPLDPTDPAPDAVLAGLGVSGTDWLLHDLIGGRLHQYQTPPMRDFELGLGFWLGVFSGGTVKVAGTPADPDQPFQWAIPGGWSIFGCPFNVAVPWDDAHVQVERDGRVLALRQALARRWIGDPIYGWARGRNVPITARRGGGRVEPWQGYLVWAQRACTLHLTHGPGALEATPEPSAVAREGWRIGLVAEVNEFGDECTQLGVSSAPETQPHPPTGPGVDLYVKAGEAFDDGTPGYALDLRADTGGPQTWDLTVSTPQPESEVVLRWPDLSELPREWEAYLSDPATGTRLRMRTAASYSFATAADGATRDLVVEVNPRSAGALAVTSLSAQPTRDGGAEIAFSLSAEAAVDVTILNIAGREVSRVASAEQMAAGAQRLLWNGRGVGGARAPSGRYLVTLQARSADGDAVSRVWAFAVQK